MSDCEYLIDASAYWRIDRGAVLAAAWRDHRERGLVWNLPADRNGDLLVAAAALGDGFAVLTDDGDYAHQISAVRPELRVRMVGDGPG
ncbi:MAG TPA: hypothetical protein VHZ33_22530 [Trebonia sp.]|nr:hypothetical protein [Trebonia sp.]